MQADTLQAYKSFVESKPLDGQLFAMPVRGLPMEREEKKATVKAIAEHYAEVAG